MHWEVEFSFIFHPSGQRQECPSSATELSRHKWLQLAFRRQGFGTAQRMQREGIKQLSQDKTTAESEQYIAIRTRIRARRKPHDKVTVREKIQHKVKDESFKTGLK